MRRFWKLVGTRRRLSAGLFTHTHTRARTPAFSLTSFLFSSAQTEKISFSWYWGLISYESRKFALTSELQLFEIFEISLVLYGVWTLNAEKKLLFGCVSSYSFWAGHLKISPCSNESASYRTDVVAALRMVCRCHHANPINSWVPVYLFANSDAHLHQRVTSTRACNLTFRQV